MVAGDHLMQALTDIDRHFGEGYALAHPELIGAHLQVTAIDLGTRGIARAVDRLAAALEPIEQLCDLVEAVKDLAGAAHAQAMWLKYLGNGDAASTMGAIEHLAVHLGEKLGDAGRVIGEAIAEAATNAVS
jgi:hypothetical protein